MRSLAVALVFCILAGAAAFADHDGIDSLQKKLQLTPEQMLRVTPIVKKYYEGKQASLKVFETQIDSVLNPEQRTKFNQIRAERPRRGGLQWFTEKLGLTTDQIAQIKEAAKGNIEQMRAARQEFLVEMKGVLTADQLAKLQEMIRAHRKSRAEGH